MIVYLIENKINNKIYIGQTITPLKERIHKHKSDMNLYIRCKKSTNRYLYASMAKYGWNNFEFSILDTAKSQEELDKIERWWIEIFQSTKRDIGYNIEFGGHGKGTVSEETKRRISQSSLGRKFPQSVRDKISASNKGKSKSKEHSKKILDIARARSKINLSDAISIRSQHNLGVSETDLGKQFGLSKRTVNDIINNKTWRQ